MITNNFKTSLKSWAFAAFLLVFTVNSAKSQPLTMGQAANNIQWELGAIVAATTYLGIDSWDWGSSHHFKFNNEGWFGLKDGSAGADKLGHMFSSYAMNEFFTYRLAQKTGNPAEASKHTALFTSAIMLGVEVFDGFSNDHGFSYEDVVMNTAGVGLSYLRNTVPGLKEKFDFRLDYKPTKVHRNHPIIDYSGQTYLGVLKLGGFEPLKATPLRFVELNVAYHTQGFKRNEQEQFPQERTELSVGVGLDLSEAFFKPAKRLMASGDNSFLDLADGFFRYYQVPDTYISTVVQERLGRDFRP